MSDSEPQLIFNHQIEGENIRVWQQADRRWLDFNDSLIQSEILLDKPTVLPLVLNRAMLAGAMFSMIPKRVLLAGTGGGATARYFANQFQDIKGDAIEKSEVVASIAQDYFDFPTAKTWQLISTDIETYIQQSQHRYDLIIIDIAVEQKTPEWIIDRQFLQQCRSSLTENGHIAFNLLVYDASECMRYLAAIRDVFDKRTVCLSLFNHQNIVVFAFNQTPSFLPENIADRLSALELIWDLELTEFYQQMLIDNPVGSGIF